MPGEHSAEDSDMSSDRYRYGIIGTGKPHGTEGVTGFGMAHTHFPNMNKTGRVELVAIADIHEGNARFFLEKYQSSARHYLDYHAMLAQERLDIVSICTWPHLHAEMAVAAAEAGVKAIHCEKPMAITWGDCKRMKAAADLNGAKLTFGHQRRHIKLFQAVRQAVRDGEIGGLVQIEAQVGDMFDWGTHWLDMMFFYNEETPADYVMGQVDSWTGRKVFGALTEDQALCQFKWKNGVRGILVVGHDASIGCVHRLIGSEGVIEVLSERSMRLRGKGDGAWKVVDVPQGDHEHIGAATDVVRQLDEPGYRSILSVDFVIQHTEVIFATYLSAKLRRRIDLPLTYDGNALMDLVESSEIGPNRKRD